MLWNGEGNENFELDEEEIKQAVSFCFDRWNLAANEQDVEGDCHVITTHYSTFLSHSIYCVTKLVYLDCQYRYVTPAKNVISFGFYDYA